MSLLTRTYVLARLHARHRFAVLGVVGVLMAVTPWVGLLREQARELQAALDARALLDPVGQAIALQRGLLMHQPAARRVLRGEWAVEPERAAHARAVDQHIAVLDGTLGAGHSRPALEEGRALEADWQALLGAIANRTIDADGSDAAHRLLVEQTLQVIDLVAAAPAADGTMATGVANRAPLGPRPLLPALEAALARAGAGGGDHDHAGWSPDLAEAHAIWRIVERQQPGTGAAHATVEVARAEAARVLARLFAPPGTGSTPASTPGSAQAAAVAWQHVARWHDAERDALASALAAETAHLRARQRETVAAGAIQSLLWLALVAMLARRRRTPAPMPARAAGERGPESLGQPDPSTEAHAAGGEHRAPARRLLERLRRPAADREPAPPPG